MKESNNQEPGTKEFLPAKYTLRICDFNDRDGYLLYYQASTPFPSYNKGDKMKTINWPLQQQGRPAFVEEIYHTVFSFGNQVTCETWVYCKFYDETQESS